MSEASKSGATGRWLRRAAPLAGRLLLELLVVFAGVYGAAMLAQRQGRLAEVDQRDALRLALAEELGQMAGIAQQMSSELDALEAYAAAIRSEARPPLRATQSYLPFTPSVWEAALASGGIELLDPALVVRLSGFYGRMDALVRLGEQRGDLVRTVLLPNLDAPLSEFYGADGQLRPKYGWYLFHLDRTIQEGRRLTDLAAELSDELSTAG